MSVCWNKSGAEVIGAAPQMPVFLSKNIHDVLNVSPCLRSL